MSSLKTTAKKIDAFVTFSRRAYLSRTAFYKKFLSVIEKECGLNIEYQWTKNLSTSPDNVYVSALKAIRESDIFIAEVSASSTSIGQQISYAALQKKPVFLCLENKMERKSNFFFLKGARQVSNITIIYYSGFHDLRDKLKVQLRKLRPATLEKFNFLATKEEKMFLARESRKRNITQSELLRSIVDQWLEDNNIV